MKPGKPLARRASLQRHTPIRTRKPMKRKPPKRTDDPGYLAKVRQLPCAANFLIPEHRCDVGGRHRWGTVAHHSLTHRRGQMRSLDRYAMPLEWWCHGDLHALTGSFKGWTKAERRDFEVRAVEWTEAAIALMEMPSDGHVARRGGGLRG